MVSPDFNRICTDAGVQCTVTSDPRTYAIIPQFKNLGKESVMISDDRASYILHPGDAFEYIAQNGKYPKVTKWFVTYDKQMP